MFQRLCFAGSLLVFTLLPVPSLHAQKKFDPKSGVAKPAAPADDLKKYDDVIPSTAKTTPGVFTVHRVDEKIYFEIPKDSFNKLILWQAEVVKGPAGVSWGGMSLGRNYIRLDRRGNRVYMWQVSFAKRADGHAIQHAVDSANLDTIIYSFKVEAEGKDRSAVVNATPLFMSDISDLSVKGAVGAGGAIDETRSYIEDIKAFPTNIEVRSLLTFRGGGGFSFGRLPFPKGGGGPSTTKSFTAVVHYSLVLLPDRPMQGRHFDPRVGYFTRSFENYSGSKKWMERQQYINRFRLEKKDPKAEVSEVVKPIVFYISREVPEKWRSYLMKGVEDWKPAFEKAGFKNAIIAREAPDLRQDPTWDPEDARYSVIRWVADPTQNAMGPHVHDPRSGEILSAHIIFWHDIVKLTQLWYFVQCSAQDERARKLPLPDELTGDLLRYVAAHEVGHTLGLRHNHRASSAYTVEQLRDPMFTTKHGTVASIMAYGRFNYVAQPEDRVKQLIPLLGPYDYFAIEWGYKPITTAKDADAERSTLDQWASRQLKDSWVRFGGEDGPATVDPTVKTENIGSDALKATELGLKNLDRVLDQLVSATTSQGEDFSLLEEAYKAVLMHRRNWFGAVALNIGGVIENRVLGGRNVETFSRIPKERQKEAVKFLLDHALTTPTKLLSPAIVNQFRYSGIANDVMSQQKSILQSLLGGSRIRRLSDAEILLQDRAYTVLELVNEVQDGVWSELNGEKPRVDVLRRSLQRSYLEILRSSLTPASDDSSGASILFGGEGGGGTTDFRAVARDALQRLQSQIDASLVRQPDAITRVHLQDCRREIEAMLAVKK